MRDSSFQAEEEGLEHQIDGPLGDRARPSGRDRLRCTVQTGGFDAAAAVRRLVAVLQGQLARVVSGQQQVVDGRCSARIGNRSQPGCRVTGGKDAGEIGAGHDVTALYEVCLVGMGCESSDKLRYAAPATAGPQGSELAFLKLRYKRPGEDNSVLMERPVTRRELQAQAPESLRFAAAVAAYADLLRGGRLSNGFTWDQVEALARGARGNDAWGYRGEFLQLVAQARSLSPARDPDVAISQD